MSVSVAQSPLENAARPHLPVSRILGYGAGDAGCNIAFQMTGLFLLIFYTDVVGISLVHAGNIFLFVKVWDAFADMFAGRMVDRSMTRWGKFRPFLLWFSAPLMASNLLAFWIPVDGYGAKLAWAVASYALAGLLYSMVNIPFGSLAGAMSQNPVDRSRLASARMVGSGTAILLLALVLAPQIKASDNLAHTFLVTAAILGVVGVGLFLTTFVTAKETVYREVAQVSLKQTIDTVKKNGPLARLCASSLYLPDRPEHRLRDGHLHRQRHPQLLCSHWHLYRGTPVRYWLEFELGEIFDVRLRPSAETADAIYDQVAERLTTDDYRPRALYERFRITVLATTNDPSEDLSAHEALAADPGWNGRVIPTFRPDRYLEPASPGWPQAVADLGKAADLETGDNAGFV